MEDMAKFKWSIVVVLLGVSMQPVYPTKPRNPPGPSHLPPDSTTLAVGGESQSSKPDSDGSSGGFSPLKP